MRIYNCTYILTHFFTQIVCVYTHTFVYTGIPCHTHVDTHWCDVNIPVQSENQNHSRFLCCSVLQCDAVCCSVLQCVAVCCSVLQCVAVCYTVLQCAAACCSALQCVAVCYSVLQGVTVCCSVLQCVVVRCSVLQCYVYMTVSTENATSLNFTKSRNSDPSISRGSNSN